MDQVFQEAAITASGGNDLFQMIAQGVDKIGAGLQNATEIVGQHTANVAAERGADTGMSL